MDVRSPGCKGTAKAASCCLLGRSVGGNGALQQRTRSISSGRPCRRIRGRERGAWKEQGGAARAQPVAGARSRESPPVARVDYGGMAPKLGLKAVKPAQGRKLCWGLDSSWGNPQGSPKVMGDGRRHGVWRSGRGSPLKRPGLSRLDPPPFLLPLQLFLPRLPSMKGVAYPTMVLLLTTDLKLQSQLTVDCTF